LKLKYKGSIFFPNARNHSSSDEASIPVRPAPSKWNFIAITNIVRIIRLCHIQEFVELCPVNPLYTRIFRLKGIKTGDFNYHYEKRKQVRQMRTVLFGVIMQWTVTLDNGTDRLSQNISMKLPAICCIIAQKSAVLTYFMADASNQESDNCTAYQTQMQAPQNKVKKHLQNLLINNKMYKSSCICVKIPPCANKLKKNTNICQRNKNTIIMATDISKEILQVTTVALLAWVQELLSFCIVICINFLGICPVLTWVGFQITFSTVPQLYSSTHIHDLSEALLHQFVMPS